MTPDDNKFGSITAPLHITTDSHSEHTKRLEDIIRDTKALRGKWQTYMNGYSLKVPPEYINHFSTGGIITIASDKYLMLFGATHWALYQRWMAAKLRTDPDNQFIRQVYRSSSEFVKPDCDGYISIDPLLARYAGLNKEVALIGMVYYFEVHNKDSYIDLNYVEGSNKLMDIARRFKHNKRH